MIIIERKCWERPSPRLRRGGIKGGGLLDHPVLLEQRLIQWLPVSAAIACPSTPHPTLPAASGGRDALDQSISTWPAPSYSNAEIANAERRLHRSLLRRCAGAALRLAHRRDRQGHDSARSQRRRQNLAAARHHRHQPSRAARFSGKAPRSGKSAPYERARAGIAYVPQGREIFPLLTVEENLKTGYAPLKRKDQHIPAEIFDLFPVLKDMLGRRGGDLSGGQQQQLSIGRALVTRPSLLVLDEPTEGIQPSIIKQIGFAIDTLPPARRHGDLAGGAIFRLRARPLRSFCRARSRAGRHGRHQSQHGGGRCTPPHVRLNRRRVGSPPSG